MKRFLLLLTIILLPSLCLADGWFFGSGAAGGGGDTCGVGGLLFSWHGEDADVTAGTPAGCSSGDTTGTAASGATISNAVYWDGGGSISFPTSDDYYSFDVSSGDIIDMSEGTFVCHVRYATFRSTSPLFRVVIDAQNYLSLYGYGTDELRLIWEGQDVPVSATTTDANIATDTWYTVTAKWNTADVDPNLWIQVCDANGENCSTAISTNTNLTAMVGTVTAITFGDANSSGGGWFMDAIKIYNTISP